MRAMRREPRVSTLHQEKLSLNLRFGDWDGPQADRFCVENRGQDSCKWAAAGFVDTDLSFLSFLELYRTDVPERRMTARRVVEPLDVVEHISAGLFSGPVHLPGRALGLQ